MITTTPSSASGRPGTAAQRWSPPDGAASSEIQPIGVLTHPARQHWQFRTSSLLWLTFTAAMTLAYARLFGTWAVLATIATAPLATLLGLAIGAGRARAADATYWGVIGATLGTLCVIAAPQPYWWMALWPVLGAVAGGISGAGRMRITIVEVVTACVISGILGALFISPRGVPLAEFGLDLAIAPVVAVAFMGLVQIVNWLQAKYRTSRDAWAAGLVFAVIAGNLWAAMVAGRWS